ncbi:MAG: hypothetical protein ACOC4M_08150 [Promethearchaeia archaeon]
MKKKIPKNVMDEILNWKSDCQSCQRIYEKIKDSYINLDTIDQSDINHLFSMFQDFGINPEPPINEFDIE